ncbi:DUF6356 family protein [Parvularcula sp. LCG005]|uniref:DUF6356 family protein n=1 Tax=Parvularcula sp. LCG005 TaxID=3078805 RepID=UPI002942195F|nr:DUF6356 family protein [Parvularcula sp. LCG005]WOI54593.1 DUF6356 family protein [Parvularcula sp. LCG005]
MAIVDKFKAHPTSVGESYFQHLNGASSIGTRMIIAGVACLLHGLFPFLFTRTGSNMLFKLHQEASERRHRADTYQPAE